MNNKENKRKNKSTASIILLTSLSYLVLGIIMVIFPNETETTLSYAMGIILTIYGLFNIISFFINAKNNMYFELIVGIIAVGFGIFSLFSPSIIIKIINIIIGVVIVIDSLMDIKHGFQLKALGLKKWWITVVISLAIIILSMFIIISPATFGDVAITILGIILIYEGISGLVIAGLIGYFSSRQSKSTDIIEVDAVDVN